MILISAFGHLYYKLEYETKGRYIRSCTRLILLICIFIIFYHFKNDIIMDLVICYNYINSTILYYNKHTSQISLFASLLWLIVSFYFLLAGIIILIIQILYIKFYISEPALEILEVDIDILN